MQFERARRAPLDHRFREQFLHQGLVELQFLHQEVGEELNWEVLRQLEFIVLFLVSGKGLLQALFEFRSLRAGNRDLFERIIGGDVRL